MKRLTILAVLVLAGCASPADDLAAICEEVNDPSLGGLGPSERATALATNIEARLKSDPIRNAWGAIASASTEHKYSLLQKAGEEAGVPGWECPALRELWTVPGAGAAPDGGTPE